MQGGERIRNPLHWVQANRGPRRVKARLGEHAARWCAQELAKVVREQSPFERVLSAIEDAEFREACVFGGFKNGVLTIRVSAPHLVELFRLRWQMDIRTRCQMHVRHVHVQRVEFIADTQGRLQA